MKLLPLSPIQFHILFALSSSSAHARLISSRIMYDSFGEIEPSPATLHDNLSVMARRGWLELGPHKTYDLTLAGRDVFESDLYRWRIVASRASEALRRT